MIQVFFRKKLNKTVIAICSSQEISQRNEDVQYYIFECLRYNGYVIRPT